MDLLGPTACQRRDIIKITVSPMWPEHMDAVEEVEKASFEFPWDRKKLESERKKKYNLPLIATVTLSDIEELLVGTLFAEEDNYRYTLHSIAVHPRWRRLGVGRALVGKIISRLKQERRYEIYELVRETNLEAQKFYRRIGFVAGKPVPDYFDNAETAYPMHFRWEWSPQGIAKLGPPAKCKRRDRLCLGGSSDCDC